MHRDKWLIIGIFGLAVGLSLFAWNHQRLRGQKVLAYYGDEMALMIRLAPEVDLWQFTEPVSDAPGARKLEELVDLDSSARARRTSLSARPGWTHARQALIEDRSYDWNAVVSSPSRWTHAIRFRRDMQEVTLLLDIDHGRVRSAGNPRVLVLNSKMADGFRKYFASDESITE